MRGLLEQAILDENLETVKRLLTEEPPAIDGQDREGVPMSFLAARTGNLPIVRYIVEYSRASMNVTDGRIGISCITRLCPAAWNWSAIWWNGWECHLFPAIMI